MSWLCYGNLNRFDQIILIIFFFKIYLKTSPQIKNRVSVGILTTLQRVLILIDFWLSQLRRAHSRSSWMSERVSEREDNRQKSAANKKVSFVPFKSPHAAPNEIRHLDRDVIFFFNSLHHHHPSLASAESAIDSHQEHSLRCCWREPPLPFFLPSVLLPPNASIRSAGRKSTSFDSI